MKGPKPRPIEERFWPKVYKTNDCWFWIAGTKGKGYGEIKSNTKKIVSAHIFSWEYHNKQKVPLGMCVMHSCDVMNCVNPKHLILGTLLDNARDAAAKGTAGRPKVLSICDN